MNDRTSFDCIVSLVLDASMTFKNNFHRRASVDKTRISSKNQTLSTTHRSKTFSSLNSSITSLNSSPSRSRASSMQESALSTSSSSGSLSSNSPSKITRSLISNKSALKIAKSFVNRRHTIWGQLTPCTSAFHNREENQQFTKSIISTENFQSYKLNLISPDQIQLTAKLG